MSRARAAEAVESGARTAELAERGTPPVEAVDSGAPRVEAAGRGSSPVPDSTWSAGDSGELYRIGRWGPPYFSIGARGRVAVRTAPGASRSIDLPAIVDEARRQGVESPLTIRFPDILRTQVARLHGAFGDAITAAGYGNRHVGVYPIKVNPLCPVVAEILEAGRAYGLGLECGSRAELAAALPHLRDDRQLLVCNGAKDGTMLELVMDAQRLGRQAIPVVQSPEEFADFLGVAARRGECPMLGVRIRLSALSADCPASVRSTLPEHKFGLTPAELLALLKRSPDVLPQLGLLHFHLGSQIADLGLLHRAAREAAQVYASLVQRGAALRYLDVGGGLGVEYGHAGCMPRPDVFSMANYASTIVDAVNTVCRSRSVPHPVLVSECGRAVTAQHAVLIVPVLSVRERPGLSADMDLSARFAAATERLVRMAVQGAGTGNAAGTPESEVAPAARSRTGGAARMPQPPSIGSSEASALLSRAGSALRKVGGAFAEGKLGLEEYAVAERAFVTVARRNLAFLREGGFDLPAGMRSTEITALEYSCADRVLCDFSVFRSLPDHWATGQDFPVMPIDRLNERPTRRGILMDLTCDGDGRIDRYISPDPDARVLPMHPPRPGVRAELGFFLMGAYEDVLGAPHNLFGRVPEVHVRTDERAVQGFCIDNIVPATSVGDLLAQMGYREAELRTAMEALVASEVAAGDLPGEAACSLIDRYTECLGQGTYYEIGDAAGPES